jgi:hypothetical protein
MISPFIKSLLGFDPEIPDEIIKRDWDKRIKNVCKPCWELKYCPYGPLIEEFPLLEPTRKESIEHNEFIKSQLKNNAYSGKKKIMFEKEVKEFNQNDYPIKNSKSDLGKTCSVFGHFCPVFFVNEPLTETKTRRKIDRNISREVMLRVVRRDNNQCQICEKFLMDNKIEFDHIIPISKGGSSEENNVQVVCFDCNRHKSNKYIPK